MRQSVDHVDLAAAGYFSDWRGRPGERAAFHLSTTDPATSVRMVRLDRRTRPAVDWKVRAEAALKVQTLDLGASITVEIADGFCASDDWALDFELRLTSEARHRVLIAGEGFALRCESQGLASLVVGGSTLVGQDGPLPIGPWLACRMRAIGGMLEATVRRWESDAILFHAATVFPASAPKTFHLAHAPTGSLPTLNAVIGRILLESGANRAAWRFPPVGRPQNLLPEDGEGARLQIHNGPTFAVRSPRWDGTDDDPRIMPAHYDAIQLHDDDLDDARWPVTHTIAVPENAETGIYGLEIAAGGHVTRWPLFVTPSKPAAALAFLAPTFTYLAYADERLPPELYPWLCDDAGHRFARANSLTSLYDVHNDGSGVSLASMLRPLATIRDDYRYPLCGDPHLLPIDLHLLAFLAEQDIAVDILTDADLHTDGATRLKAYRGLLTGSHPEYWSAAMIDAAEEFRGRGGHIAYLGGNGCYWVTASDGRNIEVRRGRHGIRTWSSEPGETHLATTGEAGGLWRRRGRAEHRLFGVGLAAMGFSRARPFVRTPQSYAPDFAWLFDGVGAAPIGDSGLLLGGASGYEIDCRSAEWGTPDHTALLAVATGFDQAYEIDPDAEVSDLPPARGEMTLTQCESGALVFAAGSVSWCGALPETGAMNPVGMITRNLLRRFTM